MLLMFSWFVVFIIQHPVLGTLDVVKFPLLHRPEKDQPTARAQKEREHDQYDQ